MKTPKNTRHAAKKCENAAPPLLDEAVIAKELAELEAVHARRLPKVNLATLTATGLSVGMTAVGLFNKAIEVGTADAAGMGMAVASAVTGCVLLTTATVSLLRIAMDATRRQAWRVILLAAALMPPLFGISTFYAVLGNAGAPSLVYDMRDRAGAWQRYADAILADAAKAGSAADTLTPIRNSISDIAEKERSGGIVSGSRGGGAVASGYASACINISAILDTLQETAVSTEERRDNVTEAIVALQTIPKDQALDVFARQDAFRAKTAELLKTIGQSKSENVAERLKAQLAIMESSVAAMDVQKGAFGTVQTGAIDGLRHSLEAVSRTVGAFVKSDASGGAAVREPSSELPDMGEAVAHYWVRNLPQILLAVLVDLMSFWFCAMLMLSRSIPKARRREFEATRERTKDADI